MSAFSELLERTPIEPEYAYLTEDPPVTGLLLRAGFNGFCWTLFNLWCPLTAVGVERLPKPPFVLCSNHTSHMDSAALMWASGLGTGQFGMLAAKDYFFDNKRRKSFLPLLMNLIPAERQTNRQAITRFLVACRAFVRHRDRCLIIYPEGTRSVTGQMAPFKRGAAMVAVELGLPLVPALVRGTFKAIPKGSNFVRPTRLTVTFGDAVNCKDFSATTTSAQYDAVNAELERRVHQLAATHAH